MNVYIYRAALYCEWCAKGIMRERHEYAPVDPSDESSFDSDHYPKGPYANGGGEADSPQHCDECGLFLENPLTPDGDAYVREQAAPYEYPDDNGDAATWSEIAARASNDNQPVLAEWIEFYFAPGM